MNEFGEYIKSLRVKKDITINQLSLYSGISASQLSRIETGKRGIPKPATIEKLAQALKADYNELMVKAGYLDTESSKETQAEKDEEEFQAFANDPSLQKWYKELPKSREEDLQKLRKMWEIIKNDNH